MATTAHYVKKAKKDIIKDGVVIVKKGEPYWWWKFYKQPRRISKNKPNNDQLKYGRYGRYGKPEFIERTEQFEETKNNLSHQTEKDDLISEVEEYRDELQQRLDNIPEQLRESNVLTEYVSQLEDLLIEIEGIEVEDED